MANREATITIGYWKIRGLLSAILYVLEHVGAKYEVVQYEQEDGPSFSRDAWLSVKEKLGLEFPNLPYLKHGDFSMTETAAIMQYIAETYDTTLLGRDVRERAKVQMVLGVVNTFKGAISQACYGSGSKDDIKSACDRHLPRFMAFVEANKFLVGDSVTFVDFAFFEALEVANLCGLDGQLYTLFPGIKAYKEKVASLPSMAKFIASSDIIKQPFNNKSAKLQAYTA